MSPALRDRYGNWVPRLPCPQMLRPGTRPEPHLSKRPCPRLPRAHPGMQGREANLAAPGTQREQPIGLGLVMAGRCRFRFGDIDLRHPKESVASGLSRRAGRADQRDRDPKHPYNDLDPSERGNRVADSFEGPDPIEWRMHTPWSLQRL